MPIADVTLKNRHTARRSCQCSSAPAAAPQRGNNDQAEAFPQIGADIGPGDRFLRFRRLSDAATIEVVRAHRDQEDADGCDSEHRQHEQTDASAAFNRQHCRAFTARWVAVHRARVRIRPPCAQAGSLGSNSSRAARCFMRRLTDAGTLRLSCTISCPAERSGCDFGGDVSVFNLADPLAQFSEINITNHVPTPRPCVPVF